MMPVVTAAGPTSAPIGRRTRSRGCATTWWPNAFGAKPMRKGCLARCPAPSNGRQRPILPPRPRDRRRYSIIPTRDCQRTSSSSAKPPSARYKGETAMPEITLVEAVNLALARAMADDATVLVLGEDVGVDGGVFRATDGLLKRFGKERVLDTPLAENVIAGMSVGLAAQGFRPVAEIQFSGFIYPTIDQLANHAARLRNRTRGRLSCPMVVRSPSGGGIRAVEHHSESTEAMFAHIPGLRVVIPSSPMRAYGLLLASIRDPDPVIFLEPSRLYRFAKQEVKNDGQALPLDTCFTLRAGDDVTLVTWGAMIKETLAAAQTLNQSGISAEVIDVATIK